MENTESALLSLLLIHFYKDTCNGELNQHLHMFFLAVLLVSLVTGKPERSTMDWKGEVRWTCNSVRFSWVAQLCPTLCNPMDCSTPGPLPITNSRSLFKLISVMSVMPSNHLILCRPLLLLPSIFPSIRVFSNNSVLCIRWPKYWSFRTYN